jgi:lipoate-protein ligase A
MHLVELTLSTPAENLALDEALLDASEQSAAPREVLRLWESPAPIVVVGRSSQVDVEVDLPYCRAQGIEVMRRVSGGAAIVAGPGSLMYAVVLSYDLRPELRSLDVAHQFVLETIRNALFDLAPSARRRGTSDLALGELKFSGNSVRCKRRHLLYHGTLLYDFDLALIERCLKIPPRQPDYRQGRSHGDFITNLPTNAEELRRALIDTWSPISSATDWPRHQVDRLVAERYGRDEWNLQR